MASRPGDGPAAGALVHTFTPNCDAGYSPFPGSGFHGGTAGALAAGVAAAQITPLLEDVLPIGKSAGQ